MSNQRVWGEDTSRGHHFTDVSRTRQTRILFRLFTFLAPAPAQDLSDDFDDRKKEERGKIRTVLLHGGVFTIRKLFPLL